MDYILSATNVTTHKQTGPETYKIEVYLKYVFKSIDFYLIHFGFKCHNNSWIEDKFNSLNGKVWFESETYKIEAHVKYLGKHLF